MPISQGSDFHTYDQRITSEVAKINLSIWECASKGTKYLIIFKSTFAVPPFVHLRKKDR